PYLVAVRDTDVNQYFKKAKHLKRYAVNILRNAAVVVFLSKPYKENVINKFVPRRYRDDILENSRVIPNGISSFWLSNKFYDKPNISFNNKIINLLFVGQVIRRKNIETTIRAITELKKRLNKKIKFIVIGEKKDLKYYDKISGLGSFEYKSYLTKEELINYYRNSDIFVMPSYTETFGLVYAEALTQGLPVIYSYDQGFDGQFKEGTVGYGVNPSNIEDIVNKIQLIFRRYATISRQCIDNVDKFDWKKISCTYKQLYTKICNK
ncbi:MAG: glycosyltransferase family 4 protein, partial [bacterium]